MAPKRNTKRTRRRKKFDWADLPDEELLDVRICDLGVRIEGSVLEERVGRLYEELENRGLEFRPHVWLSDEWFAPDGVPGIAIPFYLAHPRLARLERKQMLEVEGGTENWCMRILRHEAGHTVDTAYGLHRRQRWREVFGKYTDPYPEDYKPKPYSRSFVMHLEPWYAQSHPAEDFAETFAVWLRPRSPWRAQYQGWPALKKLEFVDELMAEISEEKPKVLSREHVDSVRAMRRTLRKHYDEKHKRYGLDLPNTFDRGLKRLFSDAPEYKSRPTAASFLRRHRSELRRVVARWTGEYHYTIDQVISEIVDRCRHLKLRLASSVAIAKRDATILLTVLTMNFIHSGFHKVML